MKFPSSIKYSHLYRLLDFSTKDRLDELSRLLTTVQENSIISSYQSIKQDVWKPLFQQEIEKLFMEKGVWGANIRKVAGKECYYIHYFQYFS